MAMGKSPYLTEPQLLHLYNGNDPSSKEREEDHVMCLAGCLVDSRVFILWLFPQTTEFKI